MATITLATLRDLWKNVSDWVKGTDAVSAPKVTISTAGRDVEELFPWNALAIADTSLVGVTVDLKRYKKVYIYAYSSLNKNVKIWYQTATGSTLYYKDGVYKDSSADPVLMTAPSARYDITSKYPQISNGLKTIRFYAQCDDIPTSGSLTLVIWGVPN